MEIEDLFEVYKKYAKHQDLHTEYHRTHLALMIVKLGEMLSWISPSANKDTDQFTDAMQALSKLYKTIEDYTVTEDYKDDSYVYIPDNKEVPHVLLNQLTDLFLHIIIYIGDNGWDDYCMTVLEDKIISDSKKSKTEQGRFKNKRL
jgi:hypothetical protein